MGRLTFFKVVATSTVPDLNVSVSAVTEVTSDDKGPKAKTFSTKLPYKGPALMANTIPKTEDWSVAGPHLLSFCRPLPASQYDVFYRLLSIVAAALASVCFINAVEISGQSNFACSHLRDDGADWSWKVLV